MNKLTRAIVVAMHRYTPFGEEFYEPILEFFLQSMKKYENEYAMLYLLDSTWNIDPQKIEGIKAKIIKVDPSLRYYDAYKEVLPLIKEHLVLFLDNDTIIYRNGLINSTFEKFEQGFDIVSIYDTIGEKTFPQLDNKSKFCPYWFAAGIAMLKDFTGCDWGPNMPHYETLGKLTENMLKDEITPYEWEEDKSNCLFNGIQDGEKSKDLGYYHVRAGSTPAYLLATEKYGNMQTYKDYLKNQPKTEYLRHCAWYQIMKGNPERIIMDSNIELVKWHDYVDRFKRYHGL